MSASVLRFDAAGAREAVPDPAALLSTWAAARLDGIAQTEEEALRAARTLLRERHTPAPIDRLSQRFGLAPFDEDVLLLMAAAERDAAIAARIAERRGLAGPARLDPALALALFAGDHPDAGALAWARLGPRAPLRRTALIGLEEGAGGALTIDERIARYLLGEDAIDARVAAWLRPVGRGTASARHAAGVDAVARGLREGSAALILGARGGGRRAVARAAAARLGLSARALRPVAVPAEPVARRAQIALLAREAMLGDLAIVLDCDTGADDADRLAHDLADDLVAGFDAPLLLLAATRPPFAPDAFEVRLAPLEPADRAALWRDALGDDGAAEALADRFALGPDAIGAVAARVGSGDARALWDAARAVAAAGLGALAERIVPRYGWADLVLPEAALADLTAIADQLRHRSAVFDAGGFGAKHARARGVTALFAGPSGTGKTMAAEVLAGALALDLYRVDLSRIVSKYIGETEKNLGAVFDAAQAGGAVLLFDEADALFGKRSEVKDSHDRYANVEISYLLQRMESHDGLAILATNLKNHLDQAFLRRIRFVVDFPMPDGALRRRLWASAFPPETATEALDLDALARMELPGGNMVVIAINAAYFAAAEARPVAMRHIARAAAAEFRKLDREFRPMWDAGS